MTLIQKLVINASLINIMASIGLILSHSSRRVLNYKMLAILKLLFCLAPRNWRNLILTLLFAKSG